jgi:hypothetical protein
MEISSENRVATSVAEAKVVAATLTKEALYVEKNLSSPTPTKQPTFTLIPTKQPTFTRIPTKKATVKVKPTITLVPTNTLAPTNTPVPVATEVPYVAQIPEGWKQFVGNGLEIYLPNSWQGGTDNDLDLVFAELKKMSPEMATLASQVEAQRNQIRFFAIDFDASSSGTNINATKICAQVPLNVTLLNDICKQTNEVYEKIGGTFTCVSQEIIQTNAYKKVGVIIAEQEINNQKVKSIQYLVDDGNCFWMFTLTTSHENFENYRKILETSMETFRITE